MRPSSTPATMLEKSSSVITRSAASRATSVPLRPMATPMLAARSAGASFTPSPVTATNSPAPCSARTTRSLADGVARPTTLSEDRRAPRAVSERPSSVAPSMAVPSSAAPRAAAPSAPCCRAGTSPMRWAMIQAVSR